MRRIALIFGCVLAACGPAKKNGQTPDAPASCTQGEMHCNGQTLQVCGPDGTLQDSQVCANVCSETLGCVLCQPGTGTCNGNVSHACNATGTGYDDTTCDPVEGSTCDAATGQCTGPCAPQAIGQSYIGCEYYPTVTGNMVGPGFGYAVAVSNASTVDAMVTVEDGGLTSPMTFTVPANSVVVQTLPWQAALKLCLGSGFDWSPCSGGAQTDGALATKGAFHLRSTVPVTVYQFNPVNYQDSSTGTTQYSYTNDASLLLPTNTWRQHYYTAGWKDTANINSGEFAVTAWQDGTMVTINAKASTPAAGGAPAFTAGTPQTITLNAGDTIELVTRNGDLSGSEIQSDKPIEVISGHYCADIPDGDCCCDHIEESMFSVDALGNKYIVNAPAVTTIPTGKVEYIRIVGTVAGTNLTYDPPQTGAPTVINNPGDVVDIPDNANSFQITADHKIMVAQYMEGQDAGGGTGDPAMALAVPVEQFRTSYLFHAPTNYESNYVDVTAPMAAVVMIDGSPVTLTAIGSSGYGLARVYPLGTGPNNDGTHTASGSMPFGITVYGYGQWTSYWYPGGLDLSDIPVN